MKPQVYQLDKISKPLEVENCAVKLYFSYNGNFQSKYDTVTFKSCHSVSLIVCDL